MRQYAARLSADVYFGVAEPRSSSSSSTQRCSSCRRKPRRSPRCWRCRPRAGRGPMTRHNSLFADGIFGAVKKSSLVGQRFIRGKLRPPPDPLFRGFLGRAGPRSASTRTTQRGPSGRRKHRRAHRGRRGRQRAGQCFQRKRRACTERRRPG